MSDRTLCLWRKNDQITAQRLNQMTCAINANTTRSEENSCKLGSLFSGSYNAVSGLPNERYVSGIDGQFMQLNRGFIIDEWDYCGTPEKIGVYVRQAGYEGALSSCYPGTPCLYKLASGTVGNETKEIMQVIKTDEYGKIIDSKIELLCEIPSDSKLWQGPELNCAGVPSEYKFYRRLGRVVNACYEYSEGSTPINKVMETNDLVMPILPARAEMEAMGDCSQSVSLIGGFKDNSILVKNISNGGGLKFDNSSGTHLELKSGVEFYAAQMCASCCGTTTTTFDISYHLNPQPFDVVIACIPVKEQHYKWCKTSNSWVTSYECGSSSCAIAPCDKGSIKITAKSMCGNNWQIGWTSSGDITIPVKDFDLSEGVQYEGGRGINICQSTETNPDGSSTSKSIICNTMEICAGCGISIEQTDTEKPTYKINACKMKLEAGEGIKVECIQGGYKVSACNSETICFNSGAGICVTKNNNVYTITNTAIHEAIEVVEGDGIKVTQTGNKYTVSLAASCCGPCSGGGTSTCYVFDPEWFTVTGNNVTINEAKVQAIGDEIAVTSTVSANITRVMERTINGPYEGDIMARMSGLEGGLCATASVTWETGTHSDIN